MLQSVTNQPAGVGEGVTVGGSGVGGIFVAVGIAVIVGAGVVAATVGDGAGVAERVAVACGVARVTATGLLSGWQPIRNNKRNNPIFVFILDILCPEA